MAKQDKNTVETATEVEMVEVATEQRAAVTADGNLTDNTAQEVSADASAATTRDPALQAVGEVLRTAPNRKAKPKTSVAEREVQAAPDYAAYGLSEEDAQEVETLRLAYTELGRRSTEHVFECGAVMSAVHQIAPDQKTFGKLVKGAFGISRTGAENLARVHRNLSEHRLRLARLGIAASSLYVMATAEAAKVEDVLVAAEAGEKLSVKRVKSLIGTVPGKPGAESERGGPAGFKARVADRTAREVVQVMDEAEALLTLTMVTLEPYRRGKRIVVKDVQRNFIAPARILRKRIERATWITLPDPEGPLEGATSEVPIARDDRWHGLWQTLAALGHFEGWPKAGDVGTWLAQTVVPQLSWLLGDRAHRSHAVIEKMEAEAERAAKRSGDKPAAGSARRNAKTAAKVSSASTESLVTGTAGA